MKNLFYLFICLFILTPGNNSRAQVKNLLGNQNGGTKIYLETSLNKDTNYNKNSRNGILEKFSTSLYYFNYSGRLMADEVTNIYDNIYSVNVDSNDLVKVPNAAEDVSIIRNNILLSIEKRPLINNVDTIFLSLSRLLQQEYELQFDAFNFSHPSLLCYLFDKFTGNKIPINISGNTVVPFYVTSNPATKASDRFMVVFTSTIPLPVTITEVKAFQKNTGVHVEWTALDEINMDLYIVEHSGDGLKFSSIGSQKASGSSSITYNIFHANPATGINYYRIKSVGKSGDIKISKVVKVNIAKRLEFVKIYPNPVDKNTINLQLNAEKGKYIILLTNKSGQLIFKKELDHSGGTSTSSFNVNSGFVTGTYQLQLIGNGQAVTQQLLKK